MEKAAPAALPREAPRVSEAQQHMDAVVGALADYDSVHGLGVTALGAELLAVGGDRLAEPRRGADPPLNSDRRLPLRGLPPFAS